MSFKIIKNKDLKSKSWSGGKTTELYIFPENASYKEFDFEFRISTATVEVEESIYTPLQGVSRTLMVLEGELELNHIGHHTSKLQPYDQDQFMGHWETHSLGVVTNFNLMTRNECQGVLKKVSLLTGEHHLPVNTKSVYYIHKGEVGFMGCKAKSGDVLILEAQKNASNIIKGVSDSILIECSIIS